MAMSRGSNVIYNVLREHEQATATLIRRLGKTARTVCLLSPDTVTWAVPHFSGSRMERSKQENAIHDEQQHQSSALG